MDLHKDGYGLTLRYTMRWISDKLYLNTHRYRKRHFSTKQHFCQQSKYKNSISNLSLSFPICVLFLNRKFCFTKTHWCLQTKNKVEPWSLDYILQQQQPPKLIERLKNALVQCPLTKSWLVRTSARVNGLAFSFNEEPKPIPPSIIDLHSLSSRFFHSKSTLVVTLDFASLSKVQIRATIIARWFCSECHRQFALAL